MSQPAPSHTAEIATPAPMQAAMQAAVVAEARTWLGTPWHHEATVKGAGVDCAMLLVSVFTATGILPAFDPRPYPVDHMLHSGDERFLGWLERFAQPVPNTDTDTSTNTNTTEPQPGDVVVYRVGRCFSHGAIVVQWPLIIHAFRDERAVVITPFNVGRLAGKAYKIMRVRPHAQVSA